MVLPLPRPLAAATARVAGRLSRWAGRGGGTTLPGLLLLRLRPSALAEMSAALPGGVMCVSGTNGKTTTTRLIRAALDAAGLNVAANTAGSNLERGAATALLENRDADMALLEVDEAALPGVVRQVAPRVLVLMNLLRDQLDRYGELEQVAERWQSMVADLDPATILVFNADDPLVAGIAAGRDTAVAFGLEDAAVGRTQLAHAADATNCRHCGAALEYRLVTIGHLGHWSCPACGLARPRTSVRADHVELRGMDGQRLQLTAGEESFGCDLQLPGLHNTYNATAAAAAAGAWGLAVHTLGSAFAQRQAAFGRGERTELGGVEVVTLLAKNPAGANENLHTLLLTGEPLHLLLLLNDRTADGRDVSWIWDVDYELLAGRLASLTLGGNRAGDMALRFRYLNGDPYGPDGETQAVTADVQPTVAAALDTALRAAGPGGRLHVLPTYTAMLEFRQVLADRGTANRFWEDR